MRDEDFKLELTDEYTRRLNHIHNLTGIPKEDVPEFCASLLLNKFSKEQLIKMFKVFIMEENIKNIS